MLQWWNSLIMWNEGKFRSVQNLIFLKFTLMKNYFHPCLFFHTFLVIICQCSKLIYLSTVGNDSVTWSGVIGRNLIPDLKLNSVLLLDYCVIHKLCITNTIIEHKGVHQCVSSLLTCGWSPTSQKAGNWGRFQVSSAWTWLTKMAPYDGYIALVTAF